MHGITALLPAYNEEVSIGSVVLRTRKYADRVVVIDDGSSDRTSEVAALAGAVVLRHAKNQGKGAALKTGFESLNGDAVIVTIDTDGQHDPADIPRLVDPILRGEADMVNGSRYLNGNKKDTPLYRRLGQSGAGHGHQSGQRSVGHRQPERLSGLFRVEQRGFPLRAEVASPSRARCWPMPLQRVYASKRWRSGCATMWASPPRTRWRTEYGYCSRCCMIWSYEDLSITSRLRGC